MLPLGKITCDHGVISHFYADDTQQSLSVAPDDTNALNPLTKCLSTIKFWMSEDFLKLNKDKTELLMIGTSTQREMILSRLGSLASQSKTAVKNLGVIIDSDLDFKSHLNSVTKTTFSHLRNIARVRPDLSIFGVKILMHAFVFSRLDYCITLYSGLPKKSIDIAFSL